MNSLGVISKAKVVKMYSFKIFTKFLFIFS